MGRRTVVKSHTAHELGRSTVAGVTSSTVPGLPLRPGDRPINPHPQYIGDAQQKKHAMPIDVWRCEGAAGGEPCGKPLHDIPKKCRVPGANLGGYPEAAFKSPRKSVAGLNTFKTSQLQLAKQGLHVTSKARQIRGDVTNAAGVKASKGRVKDHIDDVFRVDRVGPLGPKRAHDKDTAGVPSGILSVYAQGSPLDDRANVGQVESRRKTVLNITDEPVKPWERRLSRKKFITKEDIDVMKMKDAEQGFVSLFLSPRGMQFADDAADEPIAGLMQSRKNEKDYPGMLPEYRRSAAVTFPKDPAGCSSQEVKADMVGKHCDVARQLNTQDRIFGGEKHRPDSTFPDYQFDHYVGNSTHGEKGFRPDAVNDRKFIGTNEKKPSMKKSMNMYADVLYKGKLPAGQPSAADADKDPTNIDRPRDNGGSQHPQERSLQAGRGVAKSIKHSDKKLSTSTLGYVNTKELQSRKHVPPVRSQVDARKDVIAGQPTLQKSKTGGDKRQKFSDRPVHHTHSGEAIPTQLYECPAMAASPRLGQMTAVADVLKHPMGYPSGSMSARGEHVKSLVF